MPRRQQKQNEGEGQYYRWQSGSGPATMATGDQNSVRFLIETVIGIVTKARGAKFDRAQGVTSAIIDNDLCQAAQEWANRAMVNRMIPGDTPKACADRHYFKGDTVRMILAHGSPSAMELGDAMVRDPEAQKVIDDPNLPIIGGGVFGSPYNLMAVIFMGSGDPQKAGRQDQENLEQVPLRDGLQYGDPAGDRPITVEVI